MLGRMTALFAFCLCAALSVGASELPTPAQLDGKPLSAETLKAMVEAAKKVNPPRNGKNYVFGFANLQRDIAFCVIVEDSLKRNCEAAGIELRVADNRLDGPTALQNAQSFIGRNVDFVIEFQTDANFGPQIMKLFDAANIKVVAIDIPMKGATFLGVNNTRGAYMTGAYLAQAAVNKWGADAVKKGYLINAALPQSGVVTQLRTGSQLRGFTDSIPGFPKDHVIEVDGKNTLQESFVQTRNALSRIPPDALLFGMGINDQSASGVLRAFRESGRADKAIVIGQGADELKTLTTDSIFIAATAHFPEYYGNYIIPMALYYLAGNKLPEAVCVKHVPITKQNVGDYYPEYKNQGKPDFTFVFPEEQFRKYVDEVKSYDWLKDNMALVQPD